MLTSLDQPWYRFHLATWALLIVQIAAIGFARYMGDGGLCACGTTSSSITYTYGFPFIDHVYTQASRRDPASGEVIHTDRRTFNSPALAVNVASYLLLLAGTAFALESWLRSESLWRISIARLLCVTAAIAALLALWCEREDLFAWLGSYDVRVARNAFPLTLRAWHLHPISLGVATAAGALASLLISLASYAFRAGEPLPNSHAEPTRV